ncbi:hypothetical protein, partial [Azospirillum sp. SYSU D00513]|uniref:hypothetical protein n=1 Tax=Azospirillum sp. SYSU D00513 TaxID=2812561 RepID=UPI001A965FB7
PRESGGPGRFHSIRSADSWIPAFAGMTEKQLSFNTLPLGEISTLHSAFAGMTEKMLLLEQLTV